MLELLSEHLFHNMTFCSTAPNYSWRKIPICLSKRSWTAWTPLSGTRQIPVPVQCRWFWFKCTCLGSFTHFMCIESLACSMLFYSALTLPDKESSILIKDREWATKLDNSSKLKIAGTRYGLCALNHVLTFRRAVLCPLLRQLRLGWNWRWGESDIHLLLRWLDNTWTGGGAGASDWRDGDRRVQGSVYAEARLRCRWARDFLLVVYPRR